MLRNLRERMESEKGFTLIELLVVILIIGILAAIALPAFLGQQKKGQDGEAKSNARNLVTHIESCFADTQDYQSCDGAADLTNTGLNYVEAAAAGGEVSVTSAAQDSYTVTSWSKASTGGNHIYQIVHSTSGTNSRSCSSDGDAVMGEAGDTNGGCKGAAGW